ncbi:MAG TPA: Fur family transcriptional regulator [Candidatus Dormibacteraeota bacterium]|nr:Fur family transcriptional regulator [Candidatus Dormibacteraeota bacterium]
MSRSSEIFKEILKDNHLSITTQRLLVYKLLCQNQPMSMNELIKKSINKIDRVSVYRIIDTFVKTGIVQKVNLGWKYKIELSDKFQDHHHHLICLICNKTIPLRNNSLESYLNQIGLEANFQIQNHQIEIQGECQNCQTVH